MVGRRSKIAKYLLGRMTEGESAAFARKYFEDDVLFEEVLSLENDLIDQYVRGELGQSERSALESYLRRIPDGKLKVDFARALMRGVESARTMGAKEFVLKRQGLRGRTGLLAIGALCLVLVSMSILAARFVKQLSELKRTNVQRQELEARLRGAEQELESMRDKVQKGTLVRESQLPEVVEASTNLPEVILRPGGARAGVPPLTIAIPKAHIVFRIKLDSEAAYASYIVWLQTMDGRVIWRSQSLRPGRGEARSVVASIPEAVLRRDAYKLTLFAKASQGASQETGEWFFKVRRQ
ncbi:MAG: hypothetical protein ACREDR_15520 [Blastocatellia bacterium]